MLKFQKVAKKDLIEEVFGDLIKNKQWKLMAKRVILTTTNEKAFDFNSRILELIQTGDIKIYLSNDEVKEDTPKGYIQYTEQFLHSYNSSGLPPHELKLKVDTPAMLLRNINPAAGLCNGTRLLVKKMAKNVLECEILNGERSGELVWIFKYTLTSEKGRFPFMLSRKQFPIKLCYAMTINKSQG